VRCSPSATPHSSRLTQLLPGPRFALVGLWYLLTRKSGHTLPKIVAGFGLFRTLTCGGWTYVTSTDAHDKHDVFMISYLVATLPWTVGCILLSPPNPRAIKYRKYLASLFFGTLVPLVYYFIQHKVHRVPGGKCWPCWTCRQDSERLTRRSLYSLLSLRVVPDFVRCRV